MDDPFDVIKKQPSSHQLKQREKSESALANAGRNIVSQKQDQRKPKNFVKENLNRVVFEQDKVRKNAPKSVDVPTAPNKNYGKVPKYLDKFNRQREDAARQKQVDEENAKLPPGTRLMGEEERQATLADLEQAKRATNDQLERLPISMKSMRAQAQRKELEEKMTRLERAIETFSKKKVYVQV